MAPTDAFAVAAGEMRSWLGRKKLDLTAFDAGSAYVGPGSVVLHVATNSPDGTQTRRWQLREHKDGGQWLSSLVVHAPAHTERSARSWFWIDVEFAPAHGDEDDETNPPQAGVPHLVRQLLDAVEAHDSEMILGARPGLVRPDGIGPLIDVLCDPDRRLPAIVASAHNSIAFDEWHRCIEHVTRHAVGLAGIYILDPLAELAFNEAIGETHGVWRGAVRTYLTDVDPAVADDGRRHRVMSAIRIERSPVRAAGVLAGLPRELAVDSRLPKALSGLSRAGFARTSQRPASTETESDIDRLKDEHTAAMKLLDEASRTERRDRERLAELRDGLLDSSAELELANDQIADLEARLRYLRGRLESAGRGQDFNSALAIREHLPKTFADVEDRLNELAMVEFTGATDSINELDSRAQYSVWAQCTWKALAALNSYALARSKEGFNGDFKKWCDEPPKDGMSIASKRVVPGESESVRNNPKMRRKREFPVPAEVDPSRSVFMGAHIRIGGGDTVAPRLYFHDDTRRSGKIYVGYIGRHLPNKMTN